MTHLADDILDTGPSPRLGQGQSEASLEPRLTMGYRSRWPMVWREELSEAGARRRVYGDCTSWTLHLSAVKEKDGRADE